MSPRAAKPEEPRGDLPTQDDAATTPEAAAAPETATTPEATTTPAVAATPEATTRQIPLEDKMSDTIARPPHPALEERHVRVGTVVWGLVLAAVGTGLVAAALGVVFDVELAFIALVAAAGVLLLVGSLASGRRRRR